MHKYNQYSYVMNGRSFTGLVAADKIVMGRAYYNRTLYPTTDIGIEVLSNTPSVMRRMISGEFCEVDTFECTIFVWLPATEEDIFEEMFIWLNEDERPNGHCERSISVGDVIVIESNGGHQMVMSCGIGGYEPVGNKEWNSVFKIGETSIDETLADH